MIDRVQSHFNRNEKFSYQNIPKHFESVTDGSIRAIKGYCSRVIFRKYKPENFKPQALRAMLETIDGEFNSAYVELEGDYSTRLNNLQAAYEDGLADLQSQILDFSAQIDEHNAMFEDYSRLCEEVTGHKPSEELVFPTTRIDEYTKQLNELMEKSNE